MNENESPFAPGHSAHGEVDSRGDWTATEFRRAGHEAVDWIADYLDTIGDRPVLPSTQPGEVAVKLPLHPPRTPEDFGALLRDLDGIVAPGMTHWNHPGFLAYFGITASGPGILAEMVAAAFNPNGMLWKTSPVATELELRVLDWLKTMSNLPPDWFGFLLDTASMATFLALAAAREAVPGLNVREEGLARGPELCVYASDQAHVSIEKAVIALGIGRSGYRAIESDDQFRMRPDLLLRSIEEDRRAGRIPCAVVGTVGTTSTTSVDPIPELAEICARESIWLHVDAAYAGSAALLPSKHHYFDGCSEADSYVFNPHKWLFVPIDATAFYTRHPEVLRKTFCLVPDYLRSREGDVNLMDYGLQLGRRFRALKVWWVIRTFGVEGLQERIAYHCGLAEQFAEWIDESLRFERVAPVPFSTICLRGVWPDISVEETDRYNEQLAERVTDTGRAFLSTTKLKGRTVLRVAIGNIRTDAQRMKEVFELLQAEHTRLGHGGSGPDRESC